MADLVIVDIVVVATIVTRFATVVVATVVVATVVVASVVVSTVGATRNVLLQCVNVIKLDILCQMNPITNLAILGLYFIGFI